MYNNYLQNKNINVSNAKRNVPKDIKSSKSKRFFISITPIHQNRGQRTLQHGRSVNRVYQNSANRAITKSSCPKKSL
jgi:hypothetical protein